MEVPGNVKKVVGFRRTAESVERAGLWTDMNELLQSFAMRHEFRYAIRMATNELMQVEFEFAPTADAGLAYAELDGAARDLGLTMA